MDLSEELAKKMIMTAAESLAMYIEFPLKNGLVCHRIPSVESPSRDATVIGPITLLTLVNSRTKADLFENLGRILEELKFNLIIPSSESVECHQICSVDSPKEMAEVFIICSGKNQ